MPLPLLSTGTVLAAVVAAGFLVILAIQFRRKVQAHEEPHEREARIVAEGDARDRIVRRHREAAARHGLTFSKHCEHDDVWPRGMARGPLAEGVSDVGVQWAITGRLGEREVRTFFYDKRIARRRMADIEHTFWVAAIGVSPDSGPLHLVRDSAGESAVASGDADFDAVWRIDSSARAVGRHLGPDAVRLLTPDRADEWLLAGGWLVAFHRLPRALDGAVVPDVDRTLDLLPDLAEAVELR